MTEDSKDRRDEPANATPGQAQPTEQIPASAAGAPHGADAGYVPPQAPYAPYDARPGLGTYPPPSQTQPFPGQEYGAFDAQAGAPFDPQAPHGNPAFGAHGHPQPAPFGAQQAPAKRPIRTGLVLGAVALALVSGGVGGAVGALATHSDNGRSPITNALEQPKPNVNNVSNAPAGSTQAVAQKVLPSVVMIKVASSRAEGEGSGVILSTDGLILTNNHVAAGGGPNAKMDVVFSDGSTAPATIVGADPVSDLAVIKVTGKTGLTPIELGTSGNLQIGQPVVAIGSPLGLAGTVTTGIVSSLNRPVSTSGEGPRNPAAPQPVIDAIQTDAAINPGNSGGALVDGNGKLIGINTAIASLGAGEPGVGQQSGSIGLGFAIPIDQARRVADELIKTGHATYAQIGVKIQAQDTVNGARVLDATPDGPAAKAGIPAGVIVTKLNDRTIDTGDALVAAVRSHQPGDKVKVTYTDEQGNNPKTVEVTLTGAPADGGR
ncbi:S1C family serine protease [Nocardia altamirensis]|uniref:S1C family serine protease n=1 Tax=Nocardia altamirensis TaxID=472158 RepID=UPI0009FE8699|nr:trypsin-like peptidase domain-containing protein [Nocardia altamirensis]